MNDQQTLGRRKELRFKTVDDNALQCACFHEDEKPKLARIIDISSGGLRMLCDGRFSVGQAVLFELGTDRSHGTFGGVVRRVEPWVGGQCLLGCELVERIADDILEEFAHQGIINRRQDDRLDWNQPATMSWELQTGAVDIKILDASTEGMKISSPTAIPENARLRIGIDTESEEPIVVEAATIWQREDNQQHLAGVAFLNCETSASVIQILRQRNAPETRGEPVFRRPSIRPSLLVAASTILVAVTLLQSGFLP